MFKPEIIQPKSKFSIPKGRLKKGNYSKYQDMKRIFLHTTLLLMSSVSLFSNSLENEFNAASMEVATMINDIVTEDTFYVQTHDCTINGNVCIDIPFSDVGDLVFFNGGVMYTDGFEGCMEVISSSYDYSQLFGQGNIGPYRSWF